MDLEAIAKATTLERKRWLTRGLIGLYALAGASSLVLVPSLATVIIIGIAGALAWYDIRNTRRAWQASWQATQQAIETARRTIVTAAMRNYHIEDLIPTDGWSASTILAMCGQLDTTVPKASVAMAGGRILQVSVFHDIEDRRTVLVAADAEENNLLDIIRRY